MPPENLQEHLTNYLTDAHAIELQALAQLEAAPDLAADAEIAAAFSRHGAETRDHELMVRDRLEARAAGPANVKDILGTLTGEGFVAFARSQPDTTGKLVAHAFSYEHMELAAYKLLEGAAERAGDGKTADVARRIAVEERAMGERLASLFDRAVEASLRELAAEDLEEQLNKYLADAHAIEAQALKLLEKAPRLAGAAELASAYEEHREQTEEHRRLVEQRLESRGEGPSMIKDAALRLGALNWGAFFQAQPDTPAKLAAFAFAFEHLEIAAYELLGRVAARIGDTATVGLAERIVVDEHAAADRLHAHFAQALDASLHAQGVA